MKWILLSVLVIFSISLSNAIKCDSTATDTETRLKKILFCGKYDTSIKPLNTTHVRNRMIIKSFDYEDEGTLELTVWLVMAWTDIRLKWNKADYNIDLLHESTTSIWIPELNLFNEDIDIGGSSCKETMCLLRFDGYIRCVFPCVYKGQCDPDYTNWPYDRQKCGLSFGAWIHSGEHINFTTKATTVSTEDSRIHLEWKISSTSVQYMPGVYNFSSGDNSTYPSLFYAFVLERHSASFTAMITVPALICATANLVGLFLNLFSTERFVLICVNILAHLFNLQLLMYFAPHNGDVPAKIVTFSRDSLFLTGLMAIFTVILRSLSRHQGEMPVWLTSVHNTLSNTSIYRILLINGAPAAALVGSSGNQIEKIEQREDDGAVLVAMKKSETSYSSNESLWPTIALLIDRLFLLSYLITYLVLIIGFVPKGYAFLDAKSLALESGYD